MGVLEKISERVELNSEIIVKCNQLLYNVLISKEKKLSRIQQEVDKRSKILKELRLLIENRVKQDEVPIPILNLSQGNGWSALALNKDKFELIRKVMAEQENHIEILSRMMEFEVKQFESSRRETDERFLEICLKEGNVQSYHRNESIAIEIDLNKRVKEVEMREAVLVSRQAELLAKENALEAREKNLDLQKELYALKMSREKCRGELNSITLTSQMEKIEEQRKKLRNTAENLVEIKHADHDVPSKKRCPVEGATSAHPDSELTSGSKDMNKIHIEPRASSMAQINGAEQILVHEISQADSCSKYKFVPDAIDYSKSLINDFGNQRLKECFAVGQTWACYDSTEHKMPRLYVRIIEVLDNRYTFMLRTNHLRHPRDSSDSDEIHRHEGWQEWINEALPLGCGNFGAYFRILKDLHQFSHQVHCEDSCRPYCIYHSKGEIWALYKDWNIKTWTSDKELFRNCSYEIVEVLETYSLAELELLTWRR